LIVPDTNVKAMTVLYVNLKKNKKIMSHLDNAVNTLISKLSNTVKNSVEITGRCHYQLRKIYGPTKYHIDRTTEDYNEYVNSKKLRVFSVILAFNDDYEGGELCFPVQNCETKLKQGQAIAFPPYWTHPHYTNDLKNDTYRYTLTAWLYGNS
jgi:predicted 2-oxoglutarate/Fe(II)-dependent dioxygenase YbiX